MCCYIPVYPIRHSQIRDGYAQVEIDGARGVVLSELSRAFSALSVYYTLHEGDILFFPCQLLLQFLEFDAIRVALRPILELGEGLPNLIELPIQVLLLIGGEVERFNTRFEAKRESKIPLNPGQYIPLLRKRLLQCLYLLELGTLVFGEFFLDCLDLLFYLIEVGPELRLHLLQVEQVLGFVVVDQVVVLVQAADRCEQER